MIEAYKKYLRNYANFNGRSTVSDFWYVILINFLISVGLTILSKSLPEFSGLMSLLMLLYELGLLIPSLALAIRRFHDINRSGWYYLIILIPIVGILVFLGYMCAPSTNENNKYGDIVS